MYIPHIYVYIYIHRYLRDLCEQDERNVHTNIAYIIQIYIHHTNIHTYIHIYIGTYIYIYSILLDTQYYPSLGLSQNFQAQLHPRSRAARLAHLALGALGLSLRLADAAGSGGTELGSSGAAGNYMASTWRFPKMGGVYPQIIQLKKRIFRINQGSHE
jgi:hypothetical protein